jgi:RNA polymerase sigma-70 factor (ECF subfamily)
MQGYSYLEIGEMLGLSIDQVKVNIHRARKALKKELSKVYAYGN